MCFLAITTSMVAGLVLMPQVAFSGPLIIDPINNSCTFKDSNGDLVTITPPVKIKVVERERRSRGTCHDATAEENLTTDGPAIIYEGYAMSLNSCTIYYGPDHRHDFATADYTQKIDKNGTTLTCVGVEPELYPPPQTCHGRWCK